MKVCSFSIMVSERFINLGNFLSYHKCIVHVYIIIIIHVYVIQNVYTMQQHFREFPQKLMFLYPCLHATRCETIHGSLFAHVLPLFVLLDENVKLLVRSQHSSTTSNTNFVISLQMVEEYLPELLVQVLFVCVDNLLHAFPHS